MIYEAFGMTDEMRRVARELAAEGYPVLIPDLFARGPVKALCVASAIRTMLRDGNGRETARPRGRPGLARRPTRGRRRPHRRDRLLPRRQLRAAAGPHRPVPGERSLSTAAGSR